MIFDTAAYTASADPDSWKPILCWQNYIEASTITATTSTVGYPASNLAGYTTVERWQALDVTDGYLTNIFIATRSIGYIALVKHNFGTTGTQLTIQTLNVGGNPATPGDWTTQKAAFIPLNDNLILIRMPATNCDGVRVFYEPNVVIPRCSVFRAGPRLVLPQGIPPGHTPITMGRKTEKTGLKTSGRDILGIIVTSSALTTTVVQRDLDPTWYRTNMEPFRLYSDDGTVIFGWSPLIHPDEVAYCEVTNDPIPVISQKPGQIDISFELQGLL